MGERGADRDSDSDETVVDGSVMESDVEEEEFHSRSWFPFLNEDMALTTETRITEGMRSPEISFIQKYCDHTHSQRENHINPVPQEADASDQSQSLLQDWINCPSFTENISKPVFSLNAAVERQQDDSVDLDTELNGFQKDSEEEPVNGHQKEKEVISGYWTLTSSGKQTGERSSYSVEAAAYKQDLETNICQEITLNEARKAEQRRSRRIENKLRQEALARAVNPGSPISVSTMRRRNTCGETLLHRAVAHQDIGLVRKIIKSHGSVNVQDYAGWTALHRASMKGCYGIANELLKAGADVNSRQSEKITPLQEAVKEGHYEVAALLLWYGADPLIKNEMGRCALDEASDQSMRKLLERYVEKFRRHSVSGRGDSRSKLNTQIAENTDLYQMKEC
ncbi:hypothetical protein AV530_008663 [Patagioenas fasciata monilis]|uniref:Uncharacterized protein n=1 Tax=Patagioenas fasciata monilis TaxID=372326 RepID=A0A1V4L1D4_PATFA|nr:hypothetical protein AV530_008663 [Patagioenas fasciata monilis]